MTKAKAIAMTLIVAILMTLSISAVRRSGSGVRSTENAPTLAAIRHIATEPLPTTARPTNTPSLEPTQTNTPAPTRTPSPTPTATSSPTPTLTPTPLSVLTSDGISRTLTVPILMYHYISKPPRNADPIRLDLSVPPTQFAEHLVYLRAEGYTSITLSDLAFALEQGRELPPKPIILTFDDGYRDHYWNAYPLLRIYGFKGTFFLITSVIDQENPNYLSWA